MSKVLFRLTVAERKKAQKMKEKNVKWKVIQTPKKSEKCIIKAMKNPVSLTDEKQQQQNEIDRNIFHLCCS